MNDLPSALIECARLAADAYKYRVHADMMIELARFGSLAFTFGTLFFLCYRAAVRFNNLP